MFLDRHGRCWKNVKAKKMQLTSTTYLSLTKHELVREEPLVAKYSLYTTFDAAAYVRSLSIDECSRHYANWMLFAMTMRKGI